MKEENHSHTGSAGRLSGVRCLLNGREVGRLPPFTQHRLQNGRLRCDDDPARSITENRNEARQKKTILTMPLCPN
ncbi:hypothetical protein DPEC_G00216480 [Dallia pectoralis]|uniref:Uncharacterized protein n=1 Tax=Dallia pectoralis TaxID=75939 RepID=A0ACC2G2A7_DALPE|nr:hypothetical protein DPEC_G00216480 [Dallia pectoralis]